MAPATVPRWGRKQKDDLFAHFAAQTEQGIVPIPNTPIAIKQARLAVDPQRPIVSFTSNYHCLVVRYNNKILRCNAAPRRDRGGNNGTY